MRKAMKLTLAAVALLMALAVAFVPVSQSDAEGGFEITAIQYDPAEDGVLVTLNQDIATAMFGVELASATETIVDANYDSKVVEDKEFVIGLDEPLADGIYTVTVTVTTTMKDSMQFTVGTPAYSINILDSEHGTVTASASEATEGSTVHLSSMPELTYKLDSYMVYTEMGLEIPVASDNTFVMPGSNVNVRGFFVPLEPAADYTVTYVDQDGYTILPSETYKAGETVVFKVPEMGSYLVAYVEATPYVEDFDYDVETMTGTFTMPASNVKVTAYYASEESHLNFVISDGMVVYYDGNSYTSNVSFEVPFATMTSFTIGYEGAKKVMPKEVELYIGSEKQVVESFDTVYPVLVAGDITVSVSLIDYKDTEVTGEYSSKNIFDYTQIVTVKDYWTLTNGAYVEIYGKLVVPAGTTLTVDSDAVLIIYGESDISGTLIVDESITVDGKTTGVVCFGGTDAYGDYYAGDTVVKGTMDIEGNVVVFGDLTMESGSSAIVQQTGVLTTELGSAMTVGEGSVVTIYGILKSQQIVDEGIITFDSDVPCNDGTFYSIITLKGAGVIDIKKMTINGNKTLGLDLLAVKIGDDLAAALAVTASSVTPAGEDKDAHVEGCVSGIRLTIEKIMTIPYLQVSGSMEVDYAYVSESSEEVPEGITAGAALAVYNRAIVSDSFIIGEKTRMLNEAELVVTGSIDAKNGTFSNDATVFVVDSGMIVSSARIDSENGVNATRYADGGYYYYVDIDAAIAGANDKSVLHVLGTQTVKQDATLPAGAKIELGAAYQLIIGNDKDDTLTIAEGATINGIPAVADNKIDVKGTLFIENQLNVATAVKNVITADVEIFETDAEGKLVRDGWVKYTNVYTALEEAQPGDTVNLKRDIVVDGADLVIPEGVTLDTKEKNVTVMAPWKIIDNGTFDVDSKSVVTVQEKTATKDAAEVIINGIAVSDGEFDFVTDTGATYLSSGAYYSITDKKKTTWYIEPVANAVDDVLTYDEIDTVDLVGAVPGFYVRANNGIEIGDIIIAGDADTPAAMVVQTPMKAGVIALDSALVVVEPDLYFKATVTDGVGTVAVDATVQLGRACIANDQDADTERFVIGGCFDGKIVASGIVDIIDMIATTLEVQGDVLVTDDDVGGAVFQNVLVAAGGKLSVAPGAAAYVAEVLNVLGDVEVMPKTTTAASGYLWANIMLVGVDKNGRSTIAATPVVTGNIDIGDYALFNPNVVIPTEIVSNKNLKPTVFYGEKEAKVCTAYATATTTGVNENIKITVENAWLAGWALKDGTIVDAAAYGVYPAVYAEIDYYIYHVTIVADYGVQNVAIDGIILPHESIANNTYFKDLKAGVHTITVTLSTGYQGTAKVYLVQDGTPVEQTGGKVTTTGTPSTAAGFFYHIQVAGAEANSGDITIHVDPSDPTVVIQKESNEWSVSTILMLVLVILIGLMAVILFLRLNRS